MKSTGFTLIEILVAILIVGILAALAVPQYQKAVDRARFAALMPLVQTIKDAQERFYLENGFYTRDFEHLDIQMPGGYEKIEPPRVIRYANGDEYYALSREKPEEVVAGIGVSERFKNGYLLYLDHTDHAGKRVCTSYNSFGERSEYLCKSLGGVYLREGSYYKEYLLP